MDPLAETAREEVFRSSMIAAVRVLNLASAAHQRQGIAVVGQSEGVAQLVGNDVSPEVRSLLHGGLGILPDPDEVAGRTIQRPGK